MMAPGLVHLPNGLHFSVNPVFGGLAFKSTDNAHRSPFPPGWTIILNVEDHEDEPEADGQEHTDEDGTAAPRKHHIHRYKKPTLQNDHLYISSISNPSTADFRPAGSPTRQIAMMLWATLWWYFHQPPPDTRITSKASAKTAEEGRPRGDWRVNINREGIFKGKTVLAKLERMGLITSEDSSVGSVLDERASKGWSNMFVSRRAFWQMDARIYLFTYSPILNSPYPSGSPFSSRPGSPRQDGSGRNSPIREPSHEVVPMAQPLKAGPFQSSSHLPTFFPPHPVQYTFTNGIRHPIRPKPFRQGETFYIRYIPSVGQYLSFRVASLSQKPASTHGPWSNTAAMANRPNMSIGQRQSVSDSLLQTIANLEVAPTDVELLHKWMNDDRVAHFWGEAGSESHQEEFLRKGLSSKHSFPAIGCFNGKPFGYFEIYWVKEDILGKHIAGEVGDWDRGIHCLVGEQEFRGPQRVMIWLSALVHSCWLSDMRTNSVMLEPRVDNVKLEEYCYDVGFYKDREVAFPHKQANLMKIRRDMWEHPIL